MIRVATRIGGWSTKKRFDMLAFINAGADIRVGGIYLRVACQLAHGVLLDGPDP